MNLSRGWKLKIRNKMLLTLVFAVSSSWAIPEGWYIDSFQKHPEIVKWSKNFDESVVFRKNHDGYDSVVYFGRFDKAIGKKYDEVEVFGYFIRDFIPCFDPKLINLDTKNNRYYFRCRDGSAENGEDKNKKLFYAIYKDIDDLGLIVMGQNVSYREIARLGLDNNPSIQTKVQDPPAGRSGAHPSEAPVNSHNK